MTTILQAARLLLALTLLTGVLYPAFVTAFAQLAAADKANGSILRHGNEVSGSELLAQKFEKPGYFWPRPSAADFATVASGASNKGPTSTDLRKSVAERREKFGADAPAELLTASGSGLDPHLSPAGAKHQIARVAQSRGFDPEKLAALVDRWIEPPQLGFLGEPRVNVLALNRALDREFPE